MARFKLGLELKDLWVANNRKGPGGDVMQLDVMSLTMARVCMASLLTSQTR